MSETIPCNRDREERSATHCWHSTGEVLTSYPPQYQQFCCWCGTKRRLSGLAPQPDEGHGPYFEPPKSWPPGEYGGIMLCGGGALPYEVRLEVDGQWVTVIRDGGALISHIVEPLGITAAIERHRAKQPHKPDSIFKGVFDSHGNRLGPPPSEEP